MELLHIQSTFRDIINDPELATKSQSFWVSLRSDDQQLNSVNFNITVSKVDDNLVFQSIEDAGVTMTQLSKESFVISRNSRSYHLKVTKKCYHLPPERITITSFDISSKELLAILGTSRGDVVVYSMRSSRVIRKLECHKDFDVERCLFFPSGGVILTTGLDMQIKLWDLRTGQMARTFVAHTKRITDLAIFGKTGRNFLSCSNDGAVKLWECGSGKNIKDFKRITKSAGVECLCIAHNDDLESEYAEEQYGEYEFETKGVLAFAGDEGGLITEWDIFKGYQRQTFCSDESPAGSTTGVVFWTSTKNYVIGGYSSGMVKVFEYDNPGTVVKQLQISSGMAINFLKRLDNDLVISCGNDTLISLDFKSWINGVESVTYYGSVGDFNKINVGTICDHHFYTINYDDLDIVEFA